MKENGNERPYPRWVGVLLSFLIPGAGIYLSGDKTSGVRWFLSLLALAVIAEVLAPMPAIPGITAAVIAYGAELVLTIWMLVQSYRPVPKLRMRVWLLLLCLTGFLIGFMWTLPDQFTRAFTHPTSSMVPTLRPGDRLFVQTSAYWFTRPKHGDVVVFKTDAVASLPKGQYFAKRVAALPGEKVEILNGRLVIDGESLVAPAILASDHFRPPMGGLFLTATNFILVPDDGYFVVGDNAANSRDSRDFGPIPRRCIVGKATKIYWPPSRAGDIR